MGEQPRLTVQTGSIGGSISAPTARPDDALPTVSLPDINVETYPFTVVQQLLDQAAHFNLFSVPETGGAPAVALVGSGGPGTIGVRVREVLHRFAIRMEPARADVGLRARNLAGEPVGTFEHRWLFIPHGFQALPDREPPATLLDPSCSQRFVMLDGVCQFGDRRDGFRGFGTGVTFPAGDGRLLAAAVGNLTDGFGRFALREGTYTYCGTLDPDRGFTGSLMLRVMDPDGALSVEDGLPDLESGPDLEPGITYLLLRGQKRGRSQRTEYRFGADGQMVGLNVEQDLRFFDIDFAVRGRGGLRGTRSVGPVVGRMTARIDFNLLNPGAPGTGTAPIPFRSYNTYTVYDREGRIVGSFEADGGEGRTFTMELAGAPGQRALRFGGFGPLLNGTGPFGGIEGLMTDNSVVGIAPHAISTLYVLRVRDPEGRHRAAFGGGC